ncbi:uncharacterized protein K452DRAFT_281235 [Aplosporella prunicola CBS 121167]|uniref:Phospholipid/glycerol acyltransferase domain-containing protein n=1 Tax=Aplosporella prunicola CBS 121167 TaxID=1176127 RepID=A0A6A6AUL7_9PEZI|nr:uncharacterized protein K452DRAFT_281235 [Aplosporella prunicola CBS 121167]KAF2135629.1 hypothetical protein K452DRAFT_281235 [Aplosporella prunicola CBS 121167]
MPPPKSDAGIGAGFNLKSPSIDPHPSGPPQHGQLGQAERGMSVASTFLSGVLAINAAQFIGLPFKMIDPKFYNEYIAFTKQSFAVLIATLTQIWSPTKVHVSGDKSLPGQLALKPDGSLECKFPSRVVLMANHQLYTDWLYLWWIAYTNKMAGHVYIILKESLKNIPLIGWGAQFYNFIFLARNWEKDKPRFQEHLQELNKPKDPMWLIIFPEGTNLSASTRESSRRWAEKNGIQDLRHQLLPRSTGLRFCLQNLKDTTEWLYDCTIGYEGIPYGAYGQDVFTLQSSFLEGRPPKSVNMHWRRFRISQIPIEDPQAFEVWLRNRWKEKDHYLDYFARTGRFPAEDPWKAKDVKNIKPAKSLEAQVKSGSWGEFLAIFAPISAFLTVLFLFYSGSVGSLLDPGSNRSRKIQAQEEGQLQDGGLPESLAKKALKNARAAAGSEASGTSAGKPQYGEWDAIRKALEEKGAKNLGSFAPKAPSTADDVSGHRSFSQPGTRRAPSTSGPSSGDVKQPLKVDMSNDALKALLAKHLGKAENSKQLAQQTIKLANGQVIKANAPETTAVHKPASPSPVKLANGLVIGSNAKESKPSSPGPVRLANGLTVGQGSPPPTKTSSPASPKPLKKTMGSIPERNKAPLKTPSKPLQSTQLSPATKASAATTSTPSLTTAPTRSVTSAATPAKKPAKLATKAPASPAPKAQAANKPAPAPAPKAVPKADAKPAPSPAKAAPKSTSNQKTVPGGKWGQGKSEGGTGLGRTIPLSVQETNRGSKEKAAPRKMDAVQARKAANSK